MVQVIDIIPFESVGELNSLLLRMNKNERDIEVIDHAIVINKLVRYEYDDRI